MEDNEDEGEIVVLTGASGCIGFHTLSLLIERDARVREIRCLDLREPCGQMKKRIDTLLREYNESEDGCRKRKKVVNWFKGDIRDLNLIERILQDADCVIHAAAKIEAWTHWVDQDAQDLHSVNVEGTENLLKACQRLAVPKFIHVSSFETYIGYDTIYYATENTLPENKKFLFGASGSTKWDAENKVRQYANNKLNPKFRSKTSSKQQQNDQLLAVIIRFSTVYGEYDNYYVSKILELTKFFNGKLQRMSNVWIKQQSIYARNAAWSLVKAKQQLDSDQSISGEEFHITDDTDIVDPYDFVAPFVESHGMQVTQDSYPFIPAWILLWLTFTLAVFMRKFDFFGLFTSTRGRYEAAVEKDKKQQMVENSTDGQEENRTKKNRWYHFVMPQTLWFMCNSSFLNRTKASLRLDYEPIISAEESHQRSLQWYKNELSI